MKKLFFLLIVLSIFLINCKDKGCWDVRQLVLKFAIADTNTLFKLYPKDSINFGHYANNLIFYDSLGTLQPLKYVIITKNIYQNDPKYYISVGEIADMSSGNIKDYYIKWPNGQTDTLYANYRYEDCPYNNSCGCSNPLTELKLNGKSFTQKTNYDINGIYIFDR